MICAVFPCAGNIIITKWDLYSVNFRNFTTLISTNNIVKKKISGDAQCTNNIIMTLYTFVHDPRSTLIYVRFAVFFYYYIFFLLKYYTWYNNITDIWRVYTLYYVMCLTMATLRLTNQRSILLYLITSQITVISLKGV